jgi:hypothetical protein
MAPNDIPMALRRRSPHPLRDASLPHLAQSCKSRRIVITIRRLLRQSRLGCETMGSQVIGAYRLSNLMTGLVEVKLVAPAVLRVSSKEQTRQRDRHQTHH